MVTDTLHEELRRNMKTAFVEKLPAEGLIDKQQVFDVLKAAAMETFKETPPERVREFAAELSAHRMLDVFGALAASPTMQLLGALLEHAEIENMPEEGKPEHDGHHRG